MKLFKSEVDRLFGESEYLSENFSKRDFISYLLESEDLPEDSFFEKVLTAEKRRALHEKAVRILNGEPLQYVCGFAYFYRSRFFVKEGLLIPRRDSEVVVDAAVESIPKNSHFIDLCTGTGCLGLSVLLDRPDTTATLVDISDTALEVARKNAEALGVSSRCTFLKFDILKNSFDTLPEHSAVIMNPPYLTRDEMDKIPKNVSFEPTLALFGGEDGLDFYKVLAQNDKASSTLIFEIGEKQGADLLSLFGSGKIMRDYTHHDRVFLRK